MDRRAIGAIGLAAVAALAAGVLYFSNGDAPATRTVALGEVTELQFGDAELTVVRDGGDRLEIETTRRSMPWVMVREEGSFLQIGWPDDADIRMFVPHPNQNDTLRFVLQTGSLRQVTAAGGARLRIDHLEAESFKLVALSELTCILRGVDVERLEIEMAGGTGDVIAEGRAGSLYLMNSGSGDFDGSKLVAAETEVLPSGPGMSTINEGSRIETFTAP